MPSPAPGEVRVRHAAVGLNFIDTYHRTGLYPLPLPPGSGLEGAGTVEALGEGRENCRWVIASPAKTGQWEICRGAQHSGAPLLKLCRMPSVSRRPPR